MRRDCRRKPLCDDPSRSGSRNESLTISSKFFNVRPTLSDRIGHIAAAIDSIRRILAGHTRESFANDLVIRLAVERLFEVISEASRYVPSDLKAKDHTINWRG